MKFTHCRTMTRYESPLGSMLLAASERGLSGAWFLDQRHRPEPADWSDGSADPVLIQTRLQLDEYFAGKREHFDLPLDLRGGSAFQQSVWLGLLQIDRGHTTSYGALCARLGRPAAARALGAAVGRNPISIVVPCHRVIGSNGALTGYAGGLARKQALLQLEGCG